MNKSSLLKRWKTNPTTGDKIIDLTTLGGGMNTTILIKWWSYFLEMESYSPYSAFWEFYNFIKYRVCGNSWDDEI